MFHHFTDARHPRGQGALDVDQFRAILDFIGLERILPAEEWLRRFQCGELGEFATCLTFDDNLRCQYDVALPVLDELGLTAFWFVYSSPLDGVVEQLELYRYFRTVAFGSVDEFYDDFFTRSLESDLGGSVRTELESFDPAAWHPELTFYTDSDRRFRHLRDGVLASGGYDMIMNAMLEAHGFEPAGLSELLWMNANCWARLAADGHVIGLHSHTHPTAIAQLPEVDQRIEYMTNAEAIEAATGVRPVTAAHPSGSYSVQTLQVLRDLGVTTAFAVSAGVKYDASLEVQRIDSADLWALASVS